MNWRGAYPNPAQGQAPEAIHFAEAMAEAQSLRAERLEKYPALKGFQVTEITRRADYKGARDSVGRGFLQQLFNVFKSTGMDPSSRAPHALHLWRRACVRRSSLWFLRTCCTADY